MNCNILLSMTVIGVYWGGNCLVRMEVSDEM